MATRLFEGFCQAAVVVAVMAAAQHAQASITFFQQQNTLSAQISDQSLFLQENVPGPFSDLLSLDTPHVGETLNVTVSQNMNLGSSLSLGSTPISGSSLVSATGSDFFNDGSGKIFTVFGSSRARIWFTLTSAVTFNVSMAAHATGSQGFSDLTLMREDEPGVLLYTSSSDFISVDQLLTLEAGDYQLDAYADFFALGPGQWNVDAGFEFAMTVVPGPGGAALLVIALVSPRRRRR